MYGYGSGVEISTIDRVNPKVVMDTVVFVKYVNTAILPLYPDTSDIIGNFLAIIINSGPDQVNFEIL